MKNKISEHRPKHYYYSEKELGRYLAGLIDGDGNIGKNGYITIVFCERDVSLAYRLKKLVGYGSVRKVKDKKAWIYVISNKEGVVKVATWIRDKLCLESKVEAYNNYLVPRYGIDKTKLGEVSLDNGWLSGFIDSDGSLRIYTLKREGKPNEEVRLLLQIDQKTKMILSKIQKLLGGYLGYRAKHDTYYYSTVSYGNIYKVLKYIDKYPLQSNVKHLQYMYIRKSYILIQEKKHLTEKGMIKLKNYLRRSKGL